LFFFNGLHSSERGNSLNYREKFAEIFHAWLKGKQGTTIFFIHLESNIA